MLILKLSYTNQKLLIGPWQPSDPIEVASPPALCPITSSCNIQQGYEFSVDKCWMVCRTKLFLPIVELFWLQKLVRSWFTVLFTPIVNIEKQLWGSAGDELVFLQRNSIWKTIDWALKLMSLHLFSFCWAIEKCFPWKILVIKQAIYQAERSHVIGNGDRELFFPRAESNLKWDLCYIVSNNLRNLFDRCRRKTKEICVHGRHSNVSKSE